MRGREVIDTSRRLKKLIREEEKTEAKIAELQEYLAEIRASKKLEEDAEILKSFHSMERDSWDLYNLTTGIRKGNISMEMIRQLVLEAEEKASAQQDADPGEEETETAAADADLPPEGEGQGMRGRRQKDSSQHPGNDAGASTEGDALSGREAGREKKEDKDEDG